MHDDQSIAGWINRLKSGDEAAARRVWDEYFVRLTALARSRLNAATRRARDEEDVALSAINALCCGARRGQFRRLETRDDLWQLLALITCRKACTAVRRQHSRKEVGESALFDGIDVSSVGLDAIAGEPNPEFLETLSATGDQLLGRLEPKLRTVALLKLEGYTNDEIAQRQQRSVKTVERYLKMIRHEWRDA
jgi:DNA-directed RNA polymerase specialized sigma24 family protein